MLRATSRPVSMPRRPLDDDDDADDTPLDPAVERIRQRLKRLIVISSATLLVGLGAVLVAVIYKIGRAEDKAVLAAQSGEAVITGALPAGATLLSTALDGRLMALTYSDAGTVRVVVVDLSAGAVLRRARLAEAPPVTAQ